jgi:hypothetical protein
VAWYRTETCSSQSSRGKGQEMKITRKDLRRLIKEEITHMSEATRSKPWAWDLPTHARPAPDPATYTKINLDLSKIKNIDIEGIDMTDRPHFVDAFVASAEYEYSPDKFRDLTDDEIDYLNDNEPDWIYQQVWEQVY